MEETIRLIAEMLPSDSINCILFFVEEYHVELGLKKWRENITRAHLEYKKYQSTHVNGSMRFWEDDVYIITLTDWTGVDINDIHPLEDEFHFSSCRDFNHRFMEDAEFNTPELREKYQKEGKHIPYVMIANVKRKSTLCLVSLNYYYSTLYLDNEEYAHLKNIVT